MRLTKPQTEKMHTFIQERLNLINSSTFYSTLEYAYEESNIASTYDIIIRDRYDHNKKIVLVHRMPLYSVRHAIVLLSKFAIIEGVINVNPD